MSAPVRHHLPVVGDAELPQRPRTRGECVGGERPCLWVSCEHHAIHGVMLGAEGRGLDDDQVAEAIEAMPASCTLDVADARRDGDPSDATLEVVGELWGVTRERIRQIEAKAMTALRRRAEPLHEDIAEEPLVELKPSRGGAARPVEDRRRVEAPAQHAGLATPETVQSAVEGMWCPWMGAAVSGGLCARRHAARTQGSAGAGGNPGTRWPTYPGCASCADGAAVAARLGAVGELVPLRVAVPARAIDWMGDGESPGDDHDAPDARGATEDDVSKTKATRTIAERLAAANAARVTTPAAGEPCAFPGCLEPQRSYRGALDPALRPLCKAHRLRAHTIRCKQKIGAAEAVAVLLAGAGQRATPKADVASAPAPQDSAEIALVRQDREQFAQRAAAVEGELAEQRAEQETLRAQLQARAAELIHAHADVATLTATVADLRSELAAVKARPAAVASPWARLDRLAQVLRPGVVSAAWAISRDDDASGPRWTCGGYDEGEEVLWTGEGTTPDEAIAALERAVEGEAVQRVEAIRAAMEGRS